MTDEPATRLAIFGFIAIPLGLMYLSHLAWYGVEHMICGPRYPVPFRCFLGSIAGFGLMILSIPAGIFHWITQFLFGVESYALNTWLFGLSIPLCAAILFRRELFEIALNLASFTVQDERQEPQPTPREVRQASKQARERAAHQDAQTEMEEAVREMEEAKARLDALKRDQS